VASVLEKRSYPEVPPKVEYHFTPFGRKFVETFKILDDLEACLERATRAAAQDGSDRCVLS
jgi:DNA-binding HxlR family transcriptional regulator